MQTILNLNDKLTKSNKMKKNFNFTWIRRNNMFTSVHEKYLTLGTTSFCHQIDNEAEVFQLSSYRNLSNRSNCAFFLSNPRLEFISKGPTDKSL